jgi:hypothetical protein
MDPVTLLTNINTKANDVISQCFEEFFKSHVEKILHKISTEYKIPYEGLCATYLVDLPTIPINTEYTRVATNKRKRVHENSCQGLTAKGNQCSFRATRGANFCKRHMKKMYGESNTEICTVIDTKGPTNDVADISDLDGFLDEFEKHENREKSKNSRGCQFKIANGNYCTCQSLSGEVFCAKHMSTSSILDEPAHTENLLEKVVDDLDEEDEEYI